MAKPLVVRSMLLVALGMALGAFATVEAQRATAPAPPTVDADIAHLKEVVPAQSHAMIDVAYHMSNLWFAAKAKNWPFAAFEVSETRNRIRWAIRITPTVKNPDGDMVDLKSIFDAIDTSSLMMLKDAVDKKDGTAFVAAYRTMIESCYSCHKSVGKPYIRPGIPTAAPQTILNYDPNATWPK